MGLRILGCLCVISACLVGSAGAQGDTEVYEKQLSQYSTFHKEYAEQKGKELAERQAVVEKLRQEQNVLLEEYDVIETETKDTKTSIKSLTGLNEKLRKNQTELQAQYESLEALLAEQQKENVRLKDEFKNNRLDLQQRLLDSYKEESKVLSEHLIPLQARQEELEKKIKEMEETSLPGDSVQAQEANGEEQAPLE